MSHRISKRRWRQPFLAFCAASLVCASGAAPAGEDRDHERARQALEAGEVLPLRVILERVERDTPGQVVDVELELERENGRGRWVYEVKVLRGGGTLVKLKVDARDGTVIGRKQRGGHESRSGGGSEPPATGHGGGGR